MDFNKNKNDSEDSYTSVGRLFAILEILTKEGEPVPLDIVVVSIMGIGEVSLTFAAITIGLREGLLLVEKRKIDVPGLSTDYKFEGLFLISTAKGEATLNKFKGMNANYRNN